MDSIIEFFEGIDPVLGALIATTFTWFLTALGASVVFFFKTMSRKWLDGMLGFTGGVMVAASFWSLLAPAIEMSEGTGFQKAFPAAIGFGVGALFLFVLDKYTPHLHINFSREEAEGPKTHPAVCMRFGIIVGSKNGPNEPVGLNPMKTTVY